VEIQSTSHVHSSMLAAIAWKAIFGPVLLFRDVARSEMALALYADAWAFLCRYRHVSAKAACNTAFADAVTSVSATLRSIVEMALPWSDANI
jgi:hypothetical protein